MSSGYEIQHAEEDSGDAKVGSNPWKDAITVTMPTIDIEMVSATNLRDYEVWFLITTIAASFMSAFFALYVQTGDGMVAFFSIFLAVFFSISLLMTARARRLLSKKSKSYRLMTTGVEELK